MVTRYTVSSTHQEEFFGVAPTGERITMSGISIDRFEGGKIVEEWPEYDPLGMDTPARSCSCAGVGG